MSVKATYEKMARPLGVRGQQKRSFLVASFKAKREMFVESLHEHTTMLALDIDPRVINITPQPFSVRLDIEKIFPTKGEALRYSGRSELNEVSTISKQERIYTPDFAVQLLHPTPLIVESKCNEEISRIGAALERRGQILRNLGYRFLIVSSKEVEHKGLHANLVNLRDAQQCRSKNDCVALLEGLGKLISDRTGAFAFSEIRGAISDLAFYLGLIAGVIGCDLRGGHFNNRTVIWQAHGELTHLQLLPLEF